MGYELNDKELDKVLEFFREDSDIAKLLNNISQIVTREEPPYIYDPRTSDDYQSYDPLVIKTTPHNTNDFPLEIMSVDNMQQMIVTTPQPNQIPINSPTSYTIDKEGTYIPQSINSATIDPNTIHEQRISLEMHNEINSENHYQYATQITNQKQVDHDLHTFNQHQPQSNEILITNDIPILSTSYTLPSSSNITTSTPSSHHLSQGILPIDQDIFISNEDPLHASMVNSTIDSHSIIHPPGSIIPSHNHPTQIIREPVTEIPHTISNKFDTNAHVEFFGEKTLSSISKNSLTQVENSLSSSQNIICDPLIITHTPIISSDPLPQECPQDLSIPTSNYPPTYPYNSSETIGNQEEIENMLDFYDADVQIHYERDKTEVNNNIPWLKASSDNDKQVHEDSQQQYISSNSSSSIYSYPSTSSEFVNGQEYICL